MSTLYLVATPIGNIKDIGFRAVETLGAVDIIACEDTRRSLILLNHYGVKKKLLSYRQHNEKENSEQIIGLLSEGKSVALITDAGTPAISDPGCTAVKAAAEAGYTVTAIPGACAAITALSMSGMCERGFVFLGFLPPKNKDRRALVSDFVNVRLPVVFYSAVHDVSDDLAFLHKEFGDREVMMARELTKLYEQVIRGKLSDIKIDTPKGEFVIIVGGKPYAENTDDAETLYEKFSAEGMDKKEIIKKIAALRKVPKDEIYKQFINRPIR